MKFLHYIILVTTFHKVELHFIQNQNKPICANCKFFISNKNQCSKFGNMDLVSGKYNYEDANIVRNDENKCGEFAKFFEKNHFTFITVPYNYLLENSFFYWCIPIFYLYFLYSIYDPIDSQ